jgi:prepilin peptidase CpaA
VFHERHLSSVDLRITAMTSTALAIGLPFAALMLLAAASDLLTRRIPNVLTVAGVAAAPVLWAVVAGPSIALASLVGAVLAFVVGAALFAAGVLGGGDAKLLMVAGAFLGPARLVPALLAIGIVGGILALVFALWSGRLFWTLERVWHLSLHIVTLGRRGASYTVGSADALTVPYAVAIAAGSLATWLAFSSELLAR